MAAWFTVYCSRSVDQVTFAEILSEMKRGDFYTAAEVYGLVDEAAVDRALDSLKLESGDGTGGVRFRLTYGQPERRPILVYIFSDREVIAEDQDEGVELLDKASGLGVERIRIHLDRIVEVVHVELGWSQLEDIVVVFAGMVSEYLAIVGEGLIRDPYDVWWAMEDMAPVEIAAPK